MGYRTGALWDMCDRYIITVFSEATDPLHFAYRSSCATRLSNSLLGVDHTQIQSGLSPDRNNPIPITLIRNPIEKLTPINNTTITKTNVTWASWRLKSQIARLFVIQANNKENHPKLRIADPLRGESTGESPYKGQVMRRVSSSDAMKSYCMWRRMLITCTCTMTV